MRRSLRGFTLFELLVVLAILAVTAGVVVPRLGPRPSVEVEAAARLVAAGLRQARSRAVTTGAEVVLMLDLEHKRFVLRASAASPSERAPPVQARALPSGVDFRLFTARQETVDQHLGGVRFFPDGSSTGGRVTVAAGKYERLVDVDWLTGRIRVTRPEAG